jgi:hypothetical protein
MHNIMLGLRKHTPREAAIVGAATIENALKVLLESRLVGKIDSLFGIQGMLCDYGARRTLANALGLLNPMLNDDLAGIAKIRNHFAHSVRSIDFTTLGLKPDIPQTCSRFHLIEHYNEILIWQNSLDKGDAAVEINDQRGISIVHPKTRGVLAECTFSDEDIATPKGRYLTAVHLAWIVIYSTSLQVPRRIGGRRKRKVTVHDYTSL